MPVTHLVTDENITYENGAKVNTDFVSNLFGDLRIWGCPTLAGAIRDAEKKRKKEKQETKKLLKYKYPTGVLTVSHIAPLVNNGIELKVMHDECAHVRRLNSQVDKKKAIFGAGYLVSESVARQAEEARRQAEEARTIVWELSEREANNKRLAMRRIIYITILLLALALAGCRAKKPVITQVPIKEITQVELKTVEVPGDTVVLRVPFEELSKGEQTAGVATTINGLQLLWQLRQGMLELKARHPPERVEYPETTTYKEVPVEVVREIEVNHLHWWQKALMWIGVCGLIYIVLREIKNAPRKL